MPMWRCPHCGTPQAETARCWVCRRSSTACGTCRHYRRAVAADLGFCGLDKTRRPLAGDEIRSCWEAGAALPEPTLRAATPLPTTAYEDARPRLEFVEVASGGTRRPRTRPADALSADAVPEPPLPAAGAPAPGTTERWSLWGEAEA